MTVALFLALTFVASADVGLAGFFIIGLVESFGAIQLADVVAGVNIDS